tara:strand:+ start:327 stop:635 length:309 start_codon:yes stop_codon:yes gene_type:complete
MTDIISAILALDPNAEVSVSGESLDGIEWHDGNPNNITNDQITAKQSELQEAYASLQYQRDRAIAYAPLEEQLDMQYHDSVDGTTTWKDHIAEVKSKYPKPS